MKTAPDAATGPASTGPAALFLHGLDSSSRGTKGRWLREHHPSVRMADFHGDLEMRLDQLEKATAGLEALILIGSSFGGLMATCHAIRHPWQCRRLVLLAPALNFAGFRPPPRRVAVETLMVVGRFDTVCPAEQVLPLARATFAALEVRTVDADHLLHTVFPALPWEALLT